MPADPVTSPLSDLIARLRKIESEATKGPWDVEPHAEDHEGPLSVVSEYEENDEGGSSANWIAECDLQDDEAVNHANAALIAEARNAMPILLSVIEEYRRALVDIEAQHRPDTSHPSYQPCLVCGAGGGRFPCETGATVAEALVRGDQLAKGDDAS